MPVQNGDVVSVHYTGRLDNGEIFDSSEGSDPLQFEVGSGQVIPGFDAAVLGLEDGQSRTVRIPPEEAYGKRRDDLVVSLGKDMFGGHPVQVGQHLDLEDDQGNRHHADVVKVTDDAVVVDLNHHLAGEALNFEIKVVGVEKAK
jgi:FKBP-type peptidyl-prolyl cis-trans isomerase 2